MEEKRIAADDNNLLVIKYDGSLLCTGRDDYGQVSNVPPGNDFIKVDVFNNTLMALRSNGYIEVWGREYLDKIANKPNGTGYIDISIGTYVACAIRSNGTLEVWGGDNYNQISNKPTNNDYIKVISGYRNCIALRSNGYIDVWGYENGDTYKIVSTKPSYNGFIDIALTRMAAFGLKNDGTVVGWGKDNNYLLQNIPSGSNYVSISGLDNDMVAIKNDNTLYSWGYNNGLLNDENIGDIVSYSFKDGVFWAIRSNAELEFWGDYMKGLVVKTPQKLKSADGGSYYMCGVKEDGSIEVWGGVNYDEVYQIPSGNNFEQITCTNNTSHLCALRDDGSVIGWGHDTNESFASNPVNGNDITMICGCYGSIVGLRSNGGIEVWGSDTVYWLVSNKPTTNDFVKISAARFTILALKNDGSLFVWGEDTSNQVTNTPIGNDFIDIACGDYVNIALRSNGTIEVWGKDTTYLYNNKPTTNDFVKLFANQNNAAAIRADGSFVIWGDDYRYQISGAPSSIPNVEKFSFSLYSIVAIDNQNNTYAWGNDPNGILYKIPTTKDFWAILTKYLLRNNITNGVYTITDGSLEGIGTSIGPPNYIQSWWDDDAFTDLSLITQDILDQMQDDEIQILEYDASAPANKNITIEYIPEPQLILPIGDIDISNIINTDSITLTANNTGSSDLKIITSIDEGITYKTFNGSSWETVDHTDLADIKTNGMTISELNALTSTQIMNLIGDPDKIRFGYYLEITDIGETCETDEVSIQVDMPGKWKKATHQEDYDYKYLNNTTLQIKLFSNGDFKINY
jgi:alpha-tubulin suppressor-like RCC1 family protein